MGCAGLAMRKLLIAGAASAALAVPAMAADLPPGPVYKAPVVIPAYDWTGFYVGIFGSFTWTHDNSTTTNIATGAILPATSGSSSALHGGGQIGVDYMLPSRVVIGALADLSTGEYTSTTTVDANGTFTNSGQIYESGTFRARLGYAFDRILLYSTGGWSWAYGEATRDQVLGFTGNAPAGTVETEKTNHDGWTVGGGLAFAFSENWSTFVEYRYTRPIPFTELYPLAERSINTTSNTNVVEVGLNYKFHLGQDGCRWNEQVC